MLGLDLIGYKDPNERPKLISTQTFYSRTTRTFPKASEPATLKTPLNVLQTPEICQINSCTLPPSIGNLCHLHSYFLVSLPFKFYQQVPRIIKFSLCLSYFINRIRAVVLYYGCISFISKFQLSSEGDSGTPEIMVTSCPR